MVATVAPYLTLRFAAHSGLTRAHRHDSARFRHASCRSYPLFYHDGTERSVQRPVDTDEQEEYYSGKKKGHTVKNILLIGETCAVEYLSPTHAGKWHDKSIADDESYHLPADSTLYQDMGFQGFTVATVTIQQPTKKPRGGELTPEQKEENRRIASERMRIEHAICGVKRCRIVKDKIRYWQDTIRDMVMEIACGLHNFRLRFRPWHYDTRKA